MQRILGTLLYRNLPGCAARCGCSSAAATTEPQIQLPEAVIPPETLVQSLDRRTKSILAKRLAEVEYLYSISTEVPRALAEHHWRDLCEIASVQEREYFLRSIYFSELGRERTEQSNAETLKVHRERIEADRRRYEAGEMVYGTNFYSLYGCLVGADFRAMIDRLYGCRFWEAHRLGEPLTKLIIDCRNLHLIDTTNVAKCMRQIQLMYDQNWSSMDPYEIIICNFLVDDTVARAIRRHWFFLFGPPVHNAADRSHRSPSTCVDEVVASLEHNNDGRIADVLAAEDHDISCELPLTIESSQPANEGTDAAKTFEPHPFAPQVTNRSLPEVLEVAGICKEEAVYLSPWSRAFFDDELKRRQAAGSTSQIRAIVLPVQDNTNQPWHNSLSSAVADDIPAFRLPMEKHILFNNSKKPLSLINVFGCLKGVMKQGKTWAEVFEAHVPKYMRVPSVSEKVAAINENSRKLAIDEKADDTATEKEDMAEARLASAAKRKRRVKMLMEMTTVMEQRYIELREKNAQRPPRPRVHRYSREERNQSRLEQSGQNR